VSPDITIPHKKTFDDVTDGRKKTKTPENGQKIFSETDPDNNQKPTQTIIGCVLFCYHRNLFHETDYRAPIFVLLYQ